MIKPEKTINGTKWIETIQINAEERATLEDQYGVDEDIVGVVVVILAEAAAHDAVFGHFAGQKNFNHVVKLHAFFLKGVPQLLGLHGIAGEAIKQPALLTLGLQGFQHHGNGDVIGHEVAAINVSLGFFAQLGAAADVFTEDGPEIGRASCRERV